jgi:hypothetical protein
VTPQFFRTYIASLIIYAPLLVLLLIPQLMRSRAGSESQLLIGTTIFSVLCIGVFLTSSMLSARTAPVKPGWQPGTVRRTVKAMWHNQRLAFLLRAAEFWVLFVLVQAVGLAIAEALPYVWANPEHAINPSVHAWIIDYPNYAVQAIAIYFGICLAATWYSLRLRQLSTHASRV